MPGLGFRVLVAGSCSSSIHSGPVRPMLAHIVKVTVIVLLICLQVWEAHFEVTNVANTCESASAAGHSGISRLNVQSLAAS